MLRDIELWKQVISDERLLERAAGVDPSDVSAVTSLRKHASAAHVAVALQLCAARIKAAEKFGERAVSMVADVSGVEQASGRTVATYKAQRMHRHFGAGGRVHDLCCGIGGDSMAMADAGLEVIAYDRDPLRAWMTHVNTNQLATAVCSDVEDIQITGSAAHLDPARRDEAAGRRSWCIDDYKPGPQAIGKMIDAATAAAVKLSPGIDLDALPWPGEVEFISEAGRLVQAVLWAGTIAGEARRATLLQDNEQHTLAGLPAAPPIDDMQRYLYTFDAAVERAELIGQLCEQVDAPAVHPRLGLLTSDHVLGSPWLTGFELIERMPWRPRRVKQWLAGNDGGVVEVKTRGKACDPDREQRALRGEGGTTYTVFVLRFDMRVEALITRRLTPAGQAGPGTAAAGASG